MRTFFVRVAFVLLVSMALAAQVQVPDTPAGRQLSNWLAAFNSGDKATYQAFLEKNYPARAGDIDHAMSFREMTGGFDLKHAEDCGATKCSAIMQERNSEQFGRIVVEVDPAEPHAIKSFELRPIARPAEFSIPRMTEAEALKAFRGYLDQAAAADRFSGAVLVAKNGKPVFTAVYGMADREKKTPNTLNTKFRIGSMNKMFTATAVLQLVQAGKINLTDPLGKYLTDYPNKDVASKVTIHQLLTHTGGTGDFFGPEYDKHKAELHSLSDYVQLFAGKPLKFEPGKGWAYSNAGMIVAGIIVEKASGENYYDYVAAHIFKPAGMNSSGWFKRDEIKSGAAADHAPD